MESRKELARKKEIARRQNLLREAAAAGDTTTVFNLLTDREYKLDVNDQHPLSGRTALHEACVHERVEVMQLLFQFNADISIRDFASFNALDLRFNRLVLNDLKESDFIIRRNEYRYRERNIAFIISEANQRLAKAKSDYTLAFVQTEQDLLAYIQKHPKKNRIGFMMEIPNVLKRIGDDRHVFPIYFSRKNIPTFVQLESVNGFCFLMPSLPNKKTRTIFNPFPRQVALVGCLEDGISVLISLDKQGDELISFCENNSKECTKSLTKPLSDQEINQYDEWRDKYDEWKNSETEEKNPFSPDEQKKFSDLWQRRNNILESQMFQAYKLKPVDEIKRMTTLPPVLFSHVERFDTIRKFNLRPGTDFKKRHEAYRLFQWNYAYTRYRLFQTKFTGKKSAPDDHVNKEAHKIVSRITEFASGIEYDSPAEVKLAKLGRST